MSGQPVAACLRCLRDLDDLLTLELLQQHDTAAVRKAVDRLGQPTPPPGHLEASSAGGESKCSLVLASSLRMDTKLTDQRPLAAMGATVEQLMPSISHVAWWHIAC